MQLLDVSTCIVTNDQRRRNRNLWLFVDCKPNYFTFLGQLTSFWNASIL